MILSLYLPSSRFSCHLENKIQTSHCGLQAYMILASLVGHPQPHSCSSPHWPYSSSSDEVLYSLLRLCTSHPFAWSTQPSGALHAWLLLPIMSQPTNLEMISKVAPHPSPFLSGWCISLWMISLCWMYWHPTQHLSLAGINLNKHLFVFPPPNHSENIWGIW